MAGPPNAAMSIPAPLETVPSLSISEPESGLVLQAIKGLHDSLAERLEQLDTRLQHLADVMTTTMNPMPRRRSSTPKLKAGLAMQVLQMDISHLGVPVSSRSLKSRVARGKVNQTSREANELSKVGEHRLLSVSPDAAPLPGAPESSGSEGREDARALESVMRASDSKDSHAECDHGKGQEEFSDMKDSSTFSRDEDIHHGIRTSAPTSSGNLDTSYRNPKPKHAESLTSGPKRRPSMLDKAVSKGNLSEVFKVREEELTATLSNRARSETTMSPTAATAGTLSSRREVSAEILQEVTGEDFSVAEVLHDSASWWLKLNPLSTFIATYASKALGLVPWTEIDFQMDWRSRCRRYASRLYHWLLILFLLGTVTFSALRFSCCRELYQEDEMKWAMACDTHWPALAVDMFLLLGACMVLCSCGGFKNYQATTELLQESLEELTSYCDQKGLATAWKIWSCSDAVWGLLLWFALLLGRFTLFTSNAWHGGWWWGTLPFVAAYSIGTGVLVVASFWQVRTSHAMLLIVNAWSASVLRRDFNCLRSKQEWKRVSGLFRKTSRAFERCFASLGATIVMLLLSALIDLSHRQDVEILASLAVALFLPGVLWTNASTTTACNRLPSLVMLCEVSDEEEDAEYMDLAMFLHLSECGFFMWDTCVTLGFVQKFLYFTTAIAGSIGFQVGAFSA